MDKTAGLGSKIDLRLAIIRIGFFHGDHDVIQSNIDKAQLLVPPPRHSCVPRACFEDAS